jgi:hypothetical protein
LRVSRSHFVLSLLDSARSESHQFAFYPSRDASADAGFLLGLAASTIPRSLVAEIPRMLVAARYVRPIFATTNFERLHHVRLGSRICTRGKSRFTTPFSLRRTHRDFEEGFLPCPRPLRIEPLTSLSLSGFPFHCLKWGSELTIEPRPLFPAFREEYAVPNDRGCLPSVALELSSVLAIPCGIASPSPFSLAQLQRCKGLATRSSLNSPHFA